MTQLRVLVMEDDALLGIFLADMLATMGYEVCAVETTEAAAVAAASRHRPDLMIVDARLREGSGVSAVATILRSQPIPYLFISGDRHGVQEAMPGAVVLQKPFREKDLASSIHRACDTKRSMAAPERLTKAGEGSAF